MESILGQLQYNWKFDRPWHIFPTSYRLNDYLVSFAVGSIGSAPSLSAQKKNILKVLSGPLDKLMENTHCWAHLIFQWKKRAVYKEFVLGIENL